MTNTTLVQLTFKVNSDNYKEYERSLNEFLNSFVNYDVDTVETIINEEHPVSIYQVNAYDSIDIHTLYFTVRENGDRCEIYEGGEVVYEQLMEEDFTLDENDILVYLVEQADYRGYTVSTIYKKDETGKSSEVYNIRDYN